MQRRIVGALVVGVGAIHLAAAPLFYPSDVRGLIERGLVDAVEPAGLPPLSAGFWYLFAGLGMLSYGGLVWWYERHVGPAPRVAGWLLLGPAVVGVMMSGPASGFWAMGVPAIVAITSGRRGQAVAAASDAAAMGPETRSSTSS